MNGVIGVNRLDGVARKIKSNKREVIVLLTSTLDSLSLSAYYEPVESFIGFL